MSILKVNDIIEATSGGGKIFPARAWVSYNCQTTTSIRASGNISSLTDNGTGNTTISFSTSFSDANYSYTFGTKSEYADNTPRLLYVRGDHTVSTSQLRPQLSAPSGTILDVPISNVTVVR